MELITVKGTLFYLRKIMYLGDKCIALFYHDILANLIHVYVEVVNIEPTNS